MYFQGVLLSEPVGCEHYLLGSLILEYKLPGIRCGHFRALRKRFAESRGMSKSLVKIGLSKPFVKIVERNSSLVCIATTGNMYVQYPFILHTQEKISLT